MDPLYIVGFSVLGTFAVLAIIYRIIMVYRMERMLTRHTQLFEELIEIIPTNINILNQLHAQQEQVIQAMGGEKEEEPNVMGLKAE